MSRLIAHPRIFRLFMKGNFDAYVLWLLDKRDQHWVVARSIACDLMVGSNHNKEFVFVPQYKNHRRLFFRFYVSIGCCHFSDVTNFSNIQLLITTQFKYITWPGTNWLLIYNLPRKIIGETLSSRFSKNNKISATLMLLFVYTRSKL